MIPRTVPLVACLLWLAFEAQFSPSKFFDNVRNGAVEIKSSLDAVLSQNVRVVKTDETP